MDGKRNICFHCGGELIWQNDFSYDEIGVEQTDGEGNIVDGFVHELRCSNCGADVIYFISFPKDE